MRSTHTQTHSHHAVQFFSAFREPLVSFGVVDGNLCAEVLLSNKIVTHHAHPTIVTRVTESTTMGGSAAPPKTVVPNVYLARVTKGVLWTMSSSLVTFARLRDQTQTASWRGRRTSVRRSHGDRVGRDVVRSPAASLADFFCGIVHHVV